MITIWPKSFRFYCIIKIIYLTFLKEKKVHYKKLIVERFNQ